MIVLKIIVIDFLFFIVKLAEISISKLDETTFQQVKTTYRVQFLNYGKSDTELALGLDVSELEKNFKSEIFKMWDILNSDNPLLVISKKDDCCVPIATSKELQETTARIEELLKIRLGVTTKHCYAFRPTKIDRKLNIKLRIPLKESDSVQELNGKTDASMFNFRKEISVHSIRVIFNFKTKSTLAKPESKRQAFAQLIGKFY